MPKLRPDVKDERRRMLIDAAWRCAAQRRFATTTIDEVCATAGVSKGAFYGYFESKRSLLVGLLDEDASALDQIIEEIGDSTPSGVERLRRFSEAMLAHARDPGRAQVRAELWAAVLGEPELRQHFAASGTRRRLRLRAWIEEGIESTELRDVPANALASLLLATADGLMMHGTIDPTAFRWENVRRAVDELLDGIVA